MIDSFFAKNIGKLTDAFCKVTGRTNYYFAFVLTSLALALLVLDVWRSLDKGFVYRLITFVFVPILMIVFFLSMYEFHRLDRQARPLEAIKTGPWSKLFRDNKFFWLLIGIFITIQEFGWPVNLWIPAGIAGYAIDHINYGGKSVFKRAGEWIKDRIPVLGVQGVSAAVKVSE